MTDHILDSMTTLGIVLIWLGGSFFGFNAALLIAQGDLLPPFLPTTLFVSALGGFVLLLAGAILIRVGGEA